MYVMECIPLFPCHFIHYLQIQTMEHNYIPLQHIPSIQTAAYTNVYNFF